MNRLVRLMKVPDRTSIPGLRIMEKKDCQQACRLLCDYLQVLHSILYTIRVVMPVCLSPILRFYFQPKVDFKIEYSFNCNLTPMGNIERHLKFCWVLKNYIFRNSIWHPFIRRRNSSIGSCHVKVWSLPTWLKMPTMRLLTLLLFTPYPRLL